MRATTRNIAHRAFLNLGRATFQTAYNDSHMVQQFGGGVMKGEGQANIERPQNYGFSSVPLPPNQGGGGGGGQGGAPNPLQDAGWGPEAFISSHGGNPSHRYISVVDDRRHRPRGLKAGESFQYDDQGQGSYVKRDGTYIIAGGHGENADKARSSLRHVTKQRQPFPQIGGQQSGGGGGGQQGGQQQDYKHEGDPSADIFAEKDRGFAQVAKSFLAEIQSGAQYVLTDDQHTAVYAASGDNVVWVDKENCWSTKPIRVKSYPYQKPSPSSGGGGGSQ